MQYSLDVVFCSRGPNLDVVSVVTDLQTRRITRWVRRSYRVVELRAGAARSIRPGDRLEIRRPDVSAIS
jgi:hypothetical protein